MKAFNDEDNKPLPERQVESVHVTVQCDKNTERSHDVMYATDKNSDCDIYVWDSKDLAKHKINKVILNITYKPINP